MLRVIEARIRKRYAEAMLRLADHVDSARERLNAHDGFVRDRVVGLLEKTRSLWTREGQR